MCILKMFPKWNIVWSQCLYNICPSVPVSVSVSVVCPRDSTAAAMWGSFGGQSACLTSFHQLLRIDHNFTVPHVTVSTVWYHAHKVLGAWTQMFRVSRVSRGWLGVQPALPAAWLHIVVHGWQSPQANSLRFLWRRC